MIELGAHTGNVFTERFEANYSSLVRFLESMLPGSKANAIDDILQDTHIRLLAVKRKDTEEQTDASRDNYIMRVLVSRMRDSIKSHNRVARVEVHSIDEYYGATDCLRMEDRVINALALQEAMVHIRGRQHEVINLLYFQDYTITEVSRELDLDKKTVRLYRDRGLANLRKIFD